MSVETVPRDALGWLGSVETAEAAPHLTVKLARPLSTESTVKLVIRGLTAGDRQRPPARPARPRISKTVAFP